MKYLVYICTLTVVTRLKFLFNDFSNKIVFKLNFDLKKIFIAWQNYFNE